ncbi:hypothetical protein GL2_37920 [Microbulbifer sp. GL-2]|nr:hypothetical protein GL2_37920 [Microbulbifer sp. GL-2]
MVSREWEGVSRVPQKGSVDRRLCLYAALIELPASVSYGLSRTYKTFKAAFKIPAEIVPVLR